MARAIFAIVLGLAALAQAAAFPLARFIDIKPDLVLVMLLLWSALRAPREGLLWAFAAGLFLDLLTLAPLGGNALALLPVVVVGWLSRRRFFQSGLFFPLLMTLAATLAYDAVLALLDGVGMLLDPAGNGHLSLVGVARLSILGALLNLLAVPPLYVVVQLLDKWAGTVGTHARA
jgi:rod shape-determining protein MreD